MFVEINGLAYNLMFTQSIDKLDEDGKYKILYAISNENKLVEEFDNEADRDAKYEKAQAAGGASKEEIQHIEDEIEHLKEVGFHPLKVEELPTEDIKDYILYLVPSDNPDEENLCYEYLYINNAWEMVGTTSVDLSNYYTKDEALSKQGVYTYFCDANISSNFSLTITDEGVLNYLNNHIGDYSATLALSNINFGTLWIQMVMNYNTVGLFIPYFSQANVQNIKVKEIRVVKTIVDGKITEVVISNANYHNIGEKVVTDTTQVLTKNNTTSFTPTADYHPATKKYVDDALANFDDVYVVTCGHRFDGNNYNITDDGSIAEMMNTYWPKYLANSNQGGLVIWKDYTGATNGTTLIGYMWGRTIYIQWPWTSQNNGLSTHPYGSVGVVTITGSWDSNTETYTLTSAVWNRTNYVPDRDWNPANKKYVDDSIVANKTGIKYLELTSDLDIKDLEIGVYYIVTNNHTISYSCSNPAYTFTDIPDKDFIMHILYNGSDPANVCVAYWEDIEAGNQCRLYVDDFGKPKLTKSTPITAEGYYTLTGLLTFNKLPKTGSSLVPTMNEQLVNKKYVDDNKGQTIQYSTMPTADSTTVGKIVQYVGTTDANYTNGYFYIGTSVTEDNETTYEWSNINVQEGSSGLKVISDEEVYIDNLTPGWYYFTSSVARIYYYKSKDYPEYAYNTGSSFYGPVLIHRSSVSNHNQFFGLNVLSKMSSKKTSILTLDNEGWKYNYLTRTDPDLYITKTNATPFTPTSNYNPATKKYVDDAIAAAITDALGGSY